MSLVNIIMDEQSKRLCPKVRTNTIDQIEAILDMFDIGPAFRSKLVKDCQSKCFIPS